MDDAELRLGGMTTEQTEKLLQFQDLTGIEDVAICRDVLQRHGWDLEVAFQDQLNIREGRPSMFAVSARQPNVVTDALLQQFLPIPRDDERDPGVVGLFRFVVNRLFRVFYQNVATILNFFMAWFRPDPRAQLTDPLGDVMGFINTFEDKYGPNHPVFYQGTYSQALNDAKQELRFLLVFLHNDTNSQSEQFCRETLNCQEVIDIVNEHMFFWACSVNTGEGYRVSQALRERDYPFLAVIVIRDGRMTIVARMDGPVDGPELARRLRSVIRDSEPYIAVARTERMERSFNQSLRAQQDEAYQMSLRADQEKEREKSEARRRQQQAEEEQRRQLIQLEQLKEAKEREKEELLLSIPPEPDSNDAATVHLVIKLPSGSRLERRFLKTHTLRDVQNYVFCHPAAPDNFEIATNFPKRKLQPQSKETLEQAGFQRGEVLFVYDLDA